MLSIQPNLISVLFGFINDSLGMKKKARFDL